MAKSKLRQKEEQEVQEVWKHGEIRELRMEDIVPNPWNPNEMTADMFNMLSENVEDAGFLDPVLVVPLPKQAGEAQKFRIVDGEHRFEQQRLLDTPVIQCVIADPEKFDEVMQMKQTMRMNVIKGKTNPKKLAKLVTDLIENHDVPYEEMAHELGFVDPTELDRMLAQARAMLPTKEMQQEFDKAKGEIKTVDDLALVLNRLFTKYGDTLPFNFMVLDFGGKEHIWVRVEHKQFAKVRERARAAVEEGVTFDSILMQMLMSLDVKDFVDKHRDLLQRVENPTLAETVEDLFEE